MGARRELAGRDALCGRALASGGASAGVPPKKELELLAWLQGDKCPVPDMDESVAEGIVAAIKRALGYP